MRVLLLSAYDAVSHRYWREGLERYFRDYRFTQLVLPPRYFSWRIRGNSLSWGWGQRAQLEQQYDLLIATSQVDLSSLRGFVPRLARLPTLLYFHENQFAYPDSARAHPSVEPQMVNLYSALCADRLAFNSEWNRDSFLRGVAKLLRRLPDQVPAGLPEQLTRKSVLLPVPIDDVDDPAPRQGTVLDLVWNHRWEYDKGPDILLSVLRRSLQRKLPVRFHVVGQQFRRQPPAFAEMAELLASEPRAAGHWGHIESRLEYLSLLDRADLVLSTARHEFQGIAVMEAVLRGCEPIVPDRLSYAQFLPERYRYASTPAEPEREAVAIVERIERRLSRGAEQDSIAVTAVRACCWREQGPAYRSLFERCIEEHLRSESG